jgi:hypothetical protein
MMKQFIQMLIMLLIQQKCTSILIKFKVTFKADYTWKTAIIRSHKPVKELKPWRYLEKFKNALFLFFYYHCFMKHHFQIQKVIVVNYFRESYAYFQNGIFYFILFYLFIYSFARRLYRKGSYTWD